MASYILTLVLSTIVVLLQITGTQLINLPHDGIGKIHCHVNSVHGMVLSLCDTGYILRTSRRNNKVFNQNFNIKSITVHRNYDVNNF